MSVSDAWGAERDTFHKYLDEVLTDACDRVIVIGVGRTSDGGTVVHRRTAEAKFCRTSELEMLGALERAKLWFVSDLDERRKDFE